MSRTEPPKCAPEADHPGLPAVQPLQSPEEQVRHALEAIVLPVALLAAAEDASIVYVNRAFEELLGYKRCGLVNCNSARLFPRLADRRKLAQLAKDEGQVRGLELQGRTRKGQLLWLSIWQRRFTHQGRECLLTLLLDVTRDRRDRAALDEQLSSLHHLLRSSDRERELIAFDIHDGVIQDMTAALMHLQSATRALQSGRPESSHELRKVEQLLRGGIQEARRLIDGVRLPDLDQLGLVGALELLVQRISDSKDIEIDFRRKVLSNRWPAPLESSLYRIAQECLNNVWRHSKSTRARLELVQTARNIRLAVKDWGVGFDPAQADITRFGLAGVRERARLLGGSMRIRSSPGLGCIVRVIVPAEATDAPVS